MNETYRPETALRPQRVKKVSILFFTLQNATFFVKTCFHEKCGVLKREKKYAYFFDTLRPESSLRPIRFVHDLTKYLL